MTIFDSMAGRRRATPSERRHLTGPAFMALSAITAGTILGITEHTAAAVAVASAAGSVSITVNTRQK